MYHVISHQSSSDFVSERPHTGFRFTPMMTALIGVVSALLIVAVVVGIVLRLQCSNDEDHRKRRRATSEERRGRGTNSESGDSGGDKGGSSPINKLDPGGTDSGDSDEKNPDIIPQPSASKSYQRTKQHHHIQVSGKNSTDCSINVTNMMVT